MLFELISPAFAQAAEETVKKPAPIWPMLLAIFAVFYFFIIRPQQKKSKESKEMISSVVKGSRVVTIGGICGTVMNIKEKKGGAGDEDVVVIKTADNTKLEMLRSSIARTISKDNGEQKSK
ncbi:MAG: preprotein translocase subunit YajC [Candidatus Latescibacteria bacterium]|nr:preprotein translocase subunit YajC [Candidatus Latescibacterota bacterium]